MAGKVRGITIEIDGDTSKLSKALEGTNKSIAETSKELKDVNKLLKFDPKNTELLKQKQDLLKKQIENTNKKLEEEKKALEQLKQSDQSPEVSKQMRALERDIQDNEIALKNMNKQLKSISPGKMQQAGQAMQQVGGKITEAGKQISKVSAGVAALGAASMMAWKEVDKAMDTVTEKTGASGKALESMQTIAKEIAKTMPASFQESADAVGEVNTRFGLVDQALKSTSEQFIKFAKMNKTDVTTAVDATQKAMAAFNMKSKEASPFLDALNTAAQKSGISFSTLSSDLVKNASSFQAMGANAYQATSFLAQVEKSGADVDVVMAGMTKAMTNATKQGKTLPQALSELEKKMKSSKSSTASLQLAYDMFGKKGGAAIYNAMKTGTLSFDSLTKAAEKTKGSVNDTFNKTKSGADNVTPAMNALKDAGAELGNSISDTLGPMLKKLAEVLSDVAKWFKSLDPNIKQIIVIIGMVIAVLGPLLVIIGTIVSSIGAITAAIGASSFALGPLLAIIAGVIAAIAAVILVIKNWGAISAWFNNLWNGIVSGIKGLWNGLLSACNSVFNGIKNTISSIWNGIKSMTSIVWNSIKSIIGGIWNGLGITARTAFSGIKSAIAAVWNGVKAILINPIQGAWNTIKGIVNSIKNAFSFKWSLPSIKIPHISVSGGKAPYGIGGFGTLPKFQIKWYKKAEKEPFMFSKATLFGAGEHNDEILYGRESLMKDIKMATQLPNIDLSPVTSRLDRIIQLNEQLLKKNIDLYLDGVNLTRLISEKMGGQLY